LINNRKLVLDTFCEVYALLKPYADAEFWNLAEHTIIPGATYVIGRQQCMAYRDQLVELATAGTIQLALSNPHEGSDTLAGQMTRLQYKDLIFSKKIKLIGGGDMAPEWDYLRYDKFLAEILDYDENVQAARSVDQIYNKTLKPYKFLFLNGRQRSHRKYLIERLDISGSLQHALWTTLDSTPGPNRNLQLFHNDVNLMTTVRPARTLPPKYEYPAYKETANPVTDNSYVKFDLFKDEWGEIYLYPAPYIDTYFSVVTETVFEYPYSFRTEKIWKPVVMGHPWIAVASQGFYRDMHNLGFKTYGHLIDESFDSIENNQDRLERIAEVIDDLCQQDLADFLKECYNTSKYNQEHLTEMRLRVRKEFPERFSNFIRT
jgi:hypothetical protein